MHPIFARTFNAAYRHSFSVFGNPNEWFDFHDAIKLLLAIYVLLALNVSNAFGSIVLMKFEADRTIVAADSRQHQESWTDDSVCKIIEIDPHIFFFATGRAIMTDPSNHRKELWSSFSTARSAISDYSDIRGYGFVRFISTWAEMMRELYENVLIRDRQHLVSALKDPGISIGVFGRSDENGVRVYLVSIRYALPPEVSGPMVYWITREIHAGELPVFTFGDPTAFGLTTEFLADKTPRAKAANRAFRRQFASSSPDIDAQKLRAAIEAAIKWIPDKRIIGGSVDLMTVRKGGVIEWHNRKSECGTDHGAPNH